MSSAPSRAQDDVLRVTQVELQITTVPRDARTCSARPDPQGDWKLVALPYAHPRDLAWLSDGTRYVFLFRARHRPIGSSATGVFVARTHPGDVCMLFDGRPVEDVRWSRSTRWNIPLLFVGPDRTGMKGGEEELMLALSSQGSAPLLSPLAVGAYRGAVRARYERGLFLAEGVPQLTAALALLLALFSLAVWWRRRAERTHLYFALGSLSWSIYLTFYYVSPYSHGLSWAWDRFFFSLANSFLMWAIAFLFLFAARFLDFRQSWLERVLLGYAALLSLSLPVSQLALAEAGSAIWSWMLFVIPPVLGVVTILNVSRFTIRVRTREAWLLTGTFWLWLLLGAHDALQGLRWIPSEDPALLPFAALFILLAFGYAILRRYVGSLVAVERSNVELAQRLDERTRELKASHARLSAIERDQALAAERQRLMREMHDGMGSALMSSLVLVEQGKLDGTAIAAVLREAIDELKLTIDSLEPIGNDLLTLLGTLRYRLGARLERAGLKLEWNVRDLPPLPWLEAAAALQVMRIVQEALTNVVKHAQASTIRVETDSDATHAIVRIVDDGRGFDVGRCLAEAHAGRGLRNMMLRAEALGGKMEFDAQAGLNRVSLRLPRDRAE